MELRADFTQRVAVLPIDHRWVPSPQPGVERVLLDRIGDERARATSLVRYAPESVFPAHGHPGGEEIFVLSGVFEDAEESFPAGWYIRNPPGTSHRPASAPGAVLFVKLRQMAPGETRPVRVDTRRPEGWKLRDGEMVCELFDDPSERVELRRTPPDGRTLVDASGGAEILVVDGAVSSDAGLLGREAWLRIPPGDGLALVAGRHGATLYVKTGHLAQVIGATE